ncbi:hypothetical protein [Marinimicrobium locisalis]|uniref:hypothetical protein n=1 Tax=Marinimicrobium locisalis TaxID=546022 RepID=UPI0032216D95
MRSCPNCNTPLKFKDVLKATNPVIMKCSSCGEPIKAGYTPLVVGIILFAVLYIAFRTTPLAEGPNGLLAKIGFLVVLAGVFEFGYYLLLSKGVIKSNLVKS